jgi:hypothetical protein
MWQEVADQSGYTQSQAQTYCAGLTLAGYCDWRLPTRIELVSIVDFTQSGPAIDRSAFPNTPSGAFWTSSPGPGVPPHAWLVEFGDGVTTHDVATDLLSVRCVR